MRKALISLAAGVLLLLSPLLAEAQYSLIPVAPPPSFSFNDLWHFNIINADSAANAQFYVSMRIFDGSNILKVKSNTATIHLNAGANYYNLSNISLLQPFTTSFYDASLLQQAVSSGGTFPSGTYHVVYTLYGKFADGTFSPLAEEASEMVVDALWPPMLLAPPDGDSIDTQYPLLTWTPAFSSGYVGQITYTLNLVELFPGQNAYQAIQSNPFYFTQGDIPVTILPYPPSAQLLDTTKVYAWQVHAGAMGASLGSSEVWTFTFKQHALSSEVTDSLQALFYNTEYEYPSTFILTSERKIRFKFEDGYHQDTDNLLPFELYKEGRENPILTTATCNDCIVITQNIYHLIDLEDNNAFTSGFYLLKIYDSQNRVKYLRILYKDEN